MKRLERIGLRIRNVFTNEIGIRCRKEVATAVKNLYDVMIDSRESAQESSALADKVQELKKLQDQLKSATDYRLNLRDEKIKSIQKELSDLAIQYFKSVDSRERLVQNIKKVIPGVDVV